jgi:hypothetical protein
MMTAMQTQTKPERKPDALDRAAKSHQAAKAKAEQARDHLRDLVRAQAAIGESEVSLAARAGVNRLTIRTWLGKGPARLV